MEPLTSQGEAAELIFKVTYGYTTEANGVNPLEHLVDQVMEEFTRAYVPGRWAVDLIPELKCLPEWFPGTGWEKTAKAWNTNMANCINVPFEYAKARKGSSDRMSFVSKALVQGDVERGDLSSQDLGWNKLAAVSLYTGGADVTVYTMYSFFLAMAMHPDVQAKAHIELDALLSASPTRLPTFTDYTQLPYISHIIEEAQRWHPVACMGLPDCTDKEDTIAGYRILKNAVLMPTMWWSTRHSAIYHDAENKSLAVFDFKPGVDDTGKEVKLEHGFSAGVIARPAPFGVRMLPSSATHQKLVEGAVEKHGWEESSAKVIQKMMEERF